MLTQLLVLLRNRYLIVNESSYITGIELTVDGGILAGSAASPKSDIEPAPCFSEIHIFNFRVFSLIFKR